MYSRTADGTISNGEEDTVPSFFREYKFKLEKLYDRFYTVKGAKMAQQRQAAAQQFYQALYSEISDTFAQGACFLEQMLK